jgi:hypothetical protein
MLARVVKSQEIKAMCQEGVEGENDASFTASWEFSNVEIEPSIVISFRPADPLTRIYHHENT